MLHAQHQHEINQGLDDFLYNGKVYAYYPPYNVLGNQFIASEEFTIGTLWIKGEPYANVLLNYDILNQHLLLSFNTILGAKQVIVLLLALAAY